VKRFALVLLVALGGAAYAGCSGCNDNTNNSGTDSGGTGSDSGLGSDGGTAVATLTSYVIDLVANHTTATDLPRPYSEFQLLPDPDGASNNGSAYQALFP